MNSFKKFKSIPNLLALLLIRIYRSIFSPSVGILRYIPFYPKHTCIFYPTCSVYAVSCFKQYSFFKAATKTIGRISRCHPGNTPGVDQP
jgi:uncharacterized protein